MRRLGVEQVGKAGKEREKMELAVLVGVGVA